MVNRPDKRIPVVVLGGFLGAGKSTILNRLLAEAGNEATRVAVIVNEFGETSIDHLLVETVVGDTTVLKNGCICCVIRDDLTNALCELLERCSQSDGIIIDRVIIETTGLADPGPIAKSISTDALLSQQLRFAGVLCAVDALQCAGQLRDFYLCRQQIASADIAVITKGDVAGSELVRGAQALIEKLNPTATVVFRNARVDSLRPIFDLLMCGESQRQASVQGVMQARQDHMGIGSNVSGVANEIQTVSVQLCGRIEWVAFSVWLSAFVHAYADSILRIKGVIRVQGGTHPVLINVVRSFIHPPDNLDETKELPAGSTLVFITTGIQSRRVEASLRSFLAG